MGFGQPVSNDFALVFGIGNEIMKLHLKEAYTVHQICIHESWNHIKLSALDIDFGQINLIDAQFLEHRSDRPHLCADRANAIDITDKT